MLEKNVIYVLNDSREMVKSNGPKYTEAIQNRMRKTWIVAVVDALLVGYKLHKKII